MKIYAKAENSVITYFAVESDFLTGDDMSPWTEIADTEDTATISEAVANCWDGVPLKDDAGHYNYKLAGGVPTMRADAEKAADVLPIVPPTEADRLAALESAMLAMMGVQ